MTTICVNCSKEKRLKIFINETGFEGNCKLCGEINKVIEFDRDFFKALLRYYYSQWDYDTHIGGEDFYKLLNTSENPFFDKNRCKSQDLYDELLEEIEQCEAYADYEKGVSLFTGYNEYGENAPFVAIKGHLDSKIFEIRKKLKEQNYFDLENQMKPILSAYSPNCTTQINKETIYYRCRVGCDAKKKSTIIMGWEQKMVYVPYRNSKISAPPPHLASNGRINRQGVSFLYCATDKYTAIAEVRPHPGDIVSVGTFRTNRDLKIFDFTERSFIKFYKSDKTLDEYKKLNTLSELLSMTIPPSERLNYSITQLIADCIRQMGFDGILFNSSISDGYNLVLFNPHDVDYTSEQSEVVEIEEVNYEFNTKVIAETAEEIK